MKSSAMGEGGSIWVPSGFLGLGQEASRLDRARVVVLPVPYDSTTSFRTGARHGPRAIIEASYHLEDYDPELGADVSEVGIHTAPCLEPHMDGPRSMIDRVRDAAASFLAMGKVVALLGGEHSVTAGHVEALAHRYADPWGADGLTVLYLDAHADLRDEYMGTRWGHASVARRISDVCRLVQVGVRSLSEPEMRFIGEKGISTTFWPPASGPGASHGRDGVAPVGGPWGAGGQLDPMDVVALLTSDVYISVDLDVFDPALMSAVGTPEPGGMDWQQVTSLLRAVGQHRRIVGFDVTELSPDLGPPACAYIAAKLVYKLVAYATLLPGVSPRAGTSRVSETETTRREQQSFPYAGTQGRVQAMGGR